MSNTPKFIVDPLRWDQTVQAQDAGKSVPATGIFVMAAVPGGDEKSVDILLLTRKSMLTYLRKDGGSNQLAEDVVGILTGHGRLHSYG